MTPDHEVPRVCSFCEATCGVVAEVAHGAIVNVRGDKGDPFSRGFICPKAYGLKELHDDLERPRHPLKRTPTGWQEVSWPDEFSNRQPALRYCQRDGGAVRHSGYR